MAFQTLQIAPPQSWNDFEDICLALFREIWQDPMAQKHGRQGQAQQGVDFFGENRAGRGELYGVACIARTRLTQSEIEQYVSQAELFSPALAHFILATTATADVKVQAFIRQLSAERQRQGKFLVSVLSWDTVVSLLHQHPSVGRQFYPNAFPDLASRRADESLVQARQIMEAALELTRNIRGESHPETLEVMEKLRRLLREQGDSLAAEALLQRILSIREKMNRDNMAELAVADEEEKVNGTDFWHAGNEPVEQAEFVAAHRTFIKNMCLENYRYFTKLAISFESRLTVLVAQNGAGKSSILDAMACALHVFVTDFAGSKALFIQDSAVRRVTMNAELLQIESIFPSSINLDGEIDTKPIILTATRSEKGFVGTTGTWVSRAMRTALAKGQKMVLPLIAYYGTDRLRDRSSSGNVTNAHDFGTEFFSRAAGYKDCLDPSSSYKYFEKWFGYAAKADFDLRNQQREQMGNNYVPTDTAYTPLIKAVAAAVDGVLAHSGWKNLRFSFIHGNLVMNHTNGSVLEISQLSDGIRSMIAMAADIAHRAVRLNSFLGLEAVVKTPGIVLIDEVELHLHPAWQQVALDNLLATFPGIQFVVTTHSPQVLSSVPDRCIRILDNGQVFAAPKGTQGAEASRILKRIFYTELRPPENENTKLLKAYLDAVFADKWAEPEVLRMRQQLDEIFSDEEPELTRADLYIENRLWELADEENP